MLGGCFCFFLSAFLGKFLIIHKQINILFSLLLQLRFLGHKKKVTLKALRSTEGFCVASSPPVVAFSPVIHDLLPALSFLEMEDGRRRFFTRWRSPAGSVCVCFRGQLHLQSSKGNLDKMQLLKLFM